ncbi:hypothetical protein EUTSA_v10000433mg, partial [Eutrema salsugineum]
MKLKYKMEERKHPLNLNDALSSRSKHHTHYQNVIKKLQQEAAAQEAEAKDEDDEVETVGEGATEAEAETNNVPEDVSSWYLTHFIVHALGFLQCNLKKPVLFVAWFWFCFKP